MPTYAYMDSFTKGIYYWKYLLIGLTVEYMQKSLNAISTYYVQCYYDE